MSQQFPTVPANLHRLYGLCFTFLPHPEDNDTYGQFMTEMRMATEQELFNTPGHPVQRDHQTPFPVSCGQSQKPWEARPQVVGRGGLRHFQTRDGCSSNWYNHLETNLKVDPPPKKSLLKIFTLHLKLNRCLIYDLVILLLIYIF